MSLLTTFLSSPSLPPPPHTRIGQTYLRTEQQCALTYFSPSPQPRTAAERLRILCRRVYISFFCVLAFHFFLATKTKKTTQEYAQCSSPYNTCCNTLSHSIFLSCHPSPPPSSTRQQSHLPDLIPPSSHRPRFQTNLLIPDVAFVVVLWSLKQTEANTEKSEIRQTPPHKNEQTKRTNERTHPHTK